MRFKITFLAPVITTLILFTEAYEESHEIPPCLQKHDHYANSYDYSSHSPTEHGFTTYKKPATKIIRPSHPYSFSVTKKVHTPVKYSVVKKLHPVHVHKTIPVTVKKPVYYKVLKKVFYPVKVPLKVPIVKKVLVKVPKPYPVLVDRPYPVKIPKPVIVEKKVPVYINVDSHSEHKPNHEFSHDSGFDHFKTQSSHENTGSSFFNNDNSNKNQNSWNSIGHIGSSEKYFGNHAPVFGITSGDDLSGFYESSNSHFGQSNNALKTLTSGSLTPSIDHSKYFGKNHGDNTHNLFGQYATNSGGYLGNDILNAHQGHGKLNTAHFVHDTSNVVSGNNIKHEYIKHDSRKPNPHKSVSYQYVKNESGSKHPGKYTSNEYLGNGISNTHSHNSASHGYLGHGVSAGGHFNTDSFGKLSSYSGNSDNGLLSKYSGQLLPVGSHGLLKYTGPTFNSLSNEHSGHNTFSGYFGKDNRFYGYNGHSEKSLTGGLEHSSDGKYFGEDISNGHSESNKNHAHGILNGFSEHDTTSEFSGKDTKSGFSGYNGHSGNIIANGNIGYSSPNKFSSEDISNGFLRHDAFDGHSGKFGAETGNSLKSSSSNFIEYSEDENFDGLYGNKLSSGHSGHGSHSTHSSTKDLRQYVDSSSENSHSVSKTATNHAASNNIHSNNKIYHGFSDYERAPVSDSHIFSGYVDINAPSGHSTFKSAGSAHDVENSDTEYFTGYSEYVPSKNYPIDEVSSGFYGNDNSFLSSNDVKNYFSHDTLNNFNDSNNGHSGYEDSRVISKYGSSDLKKTKAHRSTGEATYNFSENDVSNQVLLGVHSDGYSGGELSNSYLTNGHSTAYENEEYTIVPSDPHHAKKFKCQK